MYTWCAENDLQINNEKITFKCMLLTTSQRQMCMKQELVVKVNEMVINTCSTYWVLGVNINNTCSWDDHVKALCRSVNYCLNTFKNRRKYLPEETRTAYCNGSTV